ncbi:YHS domain-containing protein, partial [Candidatus Microgenomates bacterium]|nr:YHS domain-containing protein [Candidatus Microgenomates bacterium]
IDMLRDLLKAHHARDPEIAKLGTFDDRTVYPIVRDPVCGMRLSVAEASKSVKYGGREYYFCASGCRQKFKAQPSKYLGMLSKTARA